MDISKILEAAKGIMGGMSSAIGDDGKKKGEKKDVMSDEMKILYKKNLPYDNKSAKDVVNSAATKVGVNPSMLFSSAFQEGMNKAIARPDDISEAYYNAGQKGLDTKAYPVDGMYNYGLDTFGQRLDEYKNDLPKDFEQRYKIYDAKNEKGEAIKTAAFRTNEDALIAKGAMLKGAGRNVDSLAAKLGIPLDEKARNYFTMATYNGGEGNAKIMMNEYAKAKDKNAFIDQGLTSRQGVHKNIAPRIARMQLANQLLTEKDQPIPVNAPQGILTGQR